MMKHIACLLLLAFAIVCPECRAQLGRYSANFAVSSSNFADSIDIEWRQGRVFVPVVMGGQTYSFLLDTGAGQAVIYSDSPFFADCVGAGRIISHDATGAADTVDMVTLPPLTLGHTTLTGCQATVQHSSVAGHQVDGILGFDIICGGLCAKIDVRGRRLILTDRKDFFDKEEGVSLRYRLNFHVPYIRVCPFGNYTETVLFDTGSRQFYSMNKQSFDRAEKEGGILLAQQVEGRSVGRHAIGQQGIEPDGEVVFLGLERLSLGRLAFTDVHAMTTQGGSHLGAALLEKCAVAFNPRRKRMLLQPYDSLTEVCVGNQQVEISFVPEQGMPVVGVVWERGIPYQQGFREGDTVVKIDGRPVQSMSQFNRWGFERGRRYTFTLRDRRGFMRDVEWVRLP